MELHLRPVFVALASLFIALPLRAEDVIYGPDGAPTVVQHKLYTLTGRVEAVAMFDVALNTALVDQLGGVVGLAYHPNEWLDVGAEGLFNHTALSSLALNVRAYLRARSPTAEHKDEFANDNQLRTGGFAVARLAPIYGKFNLASEVKVHFQAYLLGGGGVGSIHRESVNLCAVAGVDPAGTHNQCPAFQSSDSLKGVGLVGGGFRFYFGHTWSLRTEVRGYLFPSSYRADNDLTQPSSGTVSNYLAAIATFDAGLSIVF
jgi:outer membrane beta-barrel protein